MIDIDFRLRFIAADIVITFAAAIDAAIAFRLPDGWPAGWLTHRPADYFIFHWLVFIAIAIGHWCRLKLSLLYLFCH